MKAIGENSFYVVFTYIFEQGTLTNDFIVYSIKEIISQLSKLTSFKGCFDKIGDNPYISIEYKCHIIVELIKGIAETNSFRALATKKSESIQELVEIKNKILDSIKEAETVKLQTGKKEQKTTQLTHLEQ